VCATIDPVPWDTAGLDKRRRYAARHGGKDRNGAVGDTNGNLTRQWRRPIRADGEAD
jgi:hypothetical protein